MPTVWRTKATGFDAFAEPVPGNVPAALDELGVTVNRISDGEAHGHCPAHLERTGKTDRHPSWSVNVETGDHNCFSCDFKGAFVSLVEYMLDIDRLDAVAWVRERGSIERAKRLLSTNYERDEATGRLAYTEADLALFVPPPEQECEARDLDPQEVDELGILWDGEREMWIVPVRDADSGALWGWQEKNARHFRNRPTGLAKSMTLFGIHDADPAADECVLVESPLDVARLRTAGLACGVSSFGVGVSAYQMSLLLERYATIYVALDNDSDGERVSRDLRERYAHRCTLMFWNYGDQHAKDPGEQSDAEIWESYESAIPSILARFEGDA